MLNLFSRPQSEHNNLPLEEEQSSINLDFKASLNIKGKGKLWISLISLLLSGSFVAGGVTYSISNMLPAPDGETMIPKETKDKPNPLLSDSEIKE